MLISELESPKSAAGSAHDRQSFVQAEKFWWTGVGNACFQHESFIPS